jgi:hypothetical protein
MAMGAWSESFANNIVFILLKTSPTNTAPVPVPDFLELSSSNLQFFLPMGMINEDTAKNNRTCNCTIEREQSPIYISFSQHPNITSVGPVEFIFINLKGFIEMQNCKYCIIVPTLQ